MGEQSGPRSAPLALNPVGRVISGLADRDRAPHQGRGTDLTAFIEIKPEFLPAAEDISTGDLVWVLCWFDRAARDRLKVHPRGDLSRPLTGVFSTRSPARPNPVSLTLVEVLSIKDGRIEVKGLEALDGTPVIDLKPYVAAIDR
ncbi:MAG: tRNA (N6-threonylcarbamoyladenosine(37)-N6)-methyltransferase TrmO [Pseudomonadota bacterium]